LDRDQRDDQGTPRSLECFGPGQRGALARGEQGRFAPDGEVVQAQRAFAVDDGLLDVHAKGNKLARAMGVPGGPGGGAGGAMREIGEDAARRAGGGGGMRRLVAAIPLVLAAIGCASGPEPITLSFRAQALEMGEEAYLCFGFDAKKLAGRAVE